MNTKQATEIELVRRLLAAVGQPAVRLEPADRPDVVAHVGAKRIGIEVTQFHGDERLDTQGSQLRATEVQTAKVSGASPYAMWGPGDPLPGLVARITEKVAAARAYDCRTYDEMWLLVSAGLPMVGAVAATFAFAPFVNVEKLNAATHAQLYASPFSVAYFHIIMGRAVYSWSRSDQWKQEIGQQSASADPPTATQPGGG